MKRPFSMRRRLLIALMLMTLLSLVIVGGLSGVMGIHMIRDNTMRDLKVLTTVVGESCISALVFHSRETAEKRLATLAGEHQIINATLYDETGQTFALWQNPAVKKSVSSVEATKIDQPLHFDNRIVGRLVIRAHLDELARLSYLYLLLFTAITLLTLGISLVIARYFQRHLSRPINILANTMRAVSENGDYSVRVSWLGAGHEIDSLTMNLNTMLSQIENHEKALRKANLTLRKLATDLTMLEEKEKAQLSEQLHDGPLQKLALSLMQIISGANSGRDEQSYDAEAAQQLAAGTELMREAIDELRTLQFELSPPVLQQHGLAEALAWLASNTNDRWDITLRCMIAPDLPLIEPQQASVLFRSARELVNNILKHSHASCCTLSLLADRDALELVVADNGDGFDSANVNVLSSTTATNGFGLSSIRERLNLLGGYLSIQSDASGTRATIRLPLSYASSPEPDAISSATTKRIS